jgi:hypothetical protein
MERSNGHISNSAGSHKVPIHEMRLLYPLFVLEKTGVPGGIFVSFAVGASDGGRIMSRNIARAPDCGATENFSYFHCAPVPKFRTGACQKLGVF